MAMADITFCNTDFMFGLFFYYIFLYVYLNMQIVIFLFLWVFIRKVGFLLGGRAV